MAINHAVLEKTLDLWRSAGWVTQLEYWHNRTDRQRYDLLVLRSKLRGLYLPPDLGQPDED